jgi:GxxExxY protein
MKYSDLTEKIIKGAYTVHNALGFGFVEKVYQNALAVELKKMGLGVENEVPISVYYEDEVVGEYVADILVEETIIIELKAVRDLAEIHEVQLVNYLKATGKEVGLLINFGHSVQVRRKVFDNTK